MISTQYSIILPSDFDMNTIKERVKQNGFKTDGFDGLKFKFYLISEKGFNNNFYNSYAPLYLWNDTKGLNKFLFEGYYDNIINSFGWQQVKSAIPLIDKTTSKIAESKYIFAISKTIQPQSSLNNFTDQVKNEIPQIEDSEYLVVYDPEKWLYTVYYFTTEVPETGGLEGIIYNILHISTQTTI